MDNQNIHGLDAMQRHLHELQEYLQNDVKTIVGVEAVKHFKKNFQNEGFDDKKWESRKTKRFGGTSGQKVLSKSGELGDSIDYRVEGNTVVIYSDKPYAEIHNEGGDITVTPGMKKYFWAQYYMAKEIGDQELMDAYRHMALAKKIHMPKRQFMGDSDALNEKLVSKIKRDLNRILSGN